MTAPASPLPELADHRVTRLFVLDFGLFHVNAGRTIGIPGFLLETDQGARILIDTGFPDAYVHDPAIAERDGLPRFGQLVDHSHDSTLTGQLARLGLAATDITATILTHRSMSCAWAVSARIGSFCPAGADRSARVAW